MSAGSLSYVIDSMARRFASEILVAWVTSSSVSDFSWRSFCRWMPMTCCSDARGDCLSFAVMSDYFTGLIADEALVFKCVETVVPTKERNVVISGSLLCGGLRNVLKKLDVGLATDSLQPVLESNLHCLLVQFFTNTFFDRFVRGFGLGIGLDLPGLARKEFEELVPFFGFNDLADFSSL